MSKKCPDCGSLNVEEVFDGEAYCKNCHLHCSVFDLEYATVFDKIKQSPEVMADKFIYVQYTHYGTKYYMSTIVDGEWYNKEEAFAATLAKLEEEEVDDEVEEEEVKDE